MILQPVGLFQTTVGIIFLLKSLGEGGRRDLVWLRIFGPPGERPKPLMGIFPLLHPIKLSPDNTHYSLLNIAFIYLQFILN